MGNEQLQLKIWGARGSRPIPGLGTLKYGGNTSCLEAKWGEHRIILDAGTGICNLGKEIDAIKDGVEIDILITHTHWDHIMGIPFFMPLYKKKNIFHIYGVQSGHVAFKDQVSAIMVDPHFPVRFDQLSSQYELTEIEGGTTFEVLGKTDNPVRVETMVNNHPNGGISYRLFLGDKSIAYVTDYECQDEADFTKIATFIQGTDLFIFDSNYTDDEYFGKDGQPSKVGWGHSTWQMAVKLASLGEVKQCCLFHHNTERTDQELDHIEQEAKRLFNNAFAAVEGMVITL